MIIVNIMEPGKKQINNGVWTAEMVKLVETVERISTEHR